MLKALSLKCDVWTGIYGLCVDPRSDFRDGSGQRLSLHTNSILLFIRMRMLLGLAEALPSLVEARYQAAKTSQSVVFSATELAIIHTSTGIPVRSLSSTRALSLANL